MDALTTVDKHRPRRKATVSNLFSDIVPDRTGFRTASGMHLSLAGIHPPHARGDHCDRLKAEPGVAGGGVHADIAGTGPGRKRQFAVGGQ
jgi:hypothetical protein